ncbi:unnamed protein product [Acanthoscelides obtectus]|uniref:Protein phosphatase 1 regulatory subunit 12B n=1 Tax=Acanthoscelides obtectus TaxID=200917 RepID=A0A9P0NVP3_ACAOB|nr:unnamed protein product [Acanthoscelides obtectus]CAK1634797.1 Protein phosphatase 1 regulatory subunit 12A [Acanthoscelides obtectus]
MSLETRSSSALFKRAEQLKRWEESDTNRESSTPKPKSRKVKFSSGCVFLAACAAGDKDEVVRLLQKGADINTANVDGLTALHQACIDDNLDMVEFLVEHGADVNRGDNEGWTPLHATASCGFAYVARYLLERGADPAAVNCDGELPLDIADTREMEELLKQEIHNRGIDCDAARTEEETAMLQDAKEWLSTGSTHLVNAAHPGTGATALHVSAAKGYADVMRLLLQCGADVDAQDKDGWTPAHAAAHWGQRDACRLLAEHLADLDAKNYVGQTPFDLCDSDMLPYLEELRKQQNKEEVYNRRQAKKRAEVRSIESETPSKVKKVEAPPSKEDVEVQDEHVEDVEEIQRNKEKEEVVVEERQQVVTKEEQEESGYRDSPALSNDTEVTLRKPHLTIQKDTENEDSDKSGNATPEKTSSTPTSPQPNSLPQPLRSEPAAVAPATVQAPTTGNRLQILKNFFKSFVPPVRDEESETQRKAHAKRVRETRRSTQGVTLEEIKCAEQLVKKGKNGNGNGAQTTNGNDGKNSSEVQTSVTATISTATPTVTIPMPTPRDTSATSGTITNDEQPPIMIHERRPSWRLRVDNGSCKFKLEDATKPASEEDATSGSMTTPVATATSFLRRAVGGGTGVSAAPRPASAPPPVTTTVSGDVTTVTVPLRRPRSQQQDDKASDQDKENDASRNSQATMLATQAAIQRRRRPKRRSTGVVNFDGLEDMDNEKDSNSKDCDESSKLNHAESGSERSSRSRLNSTSDIRNENGEIDYKKLYEQQLAENDRLKDKLRKSEEELRDTKQTLEKLNVVTSKNSLSELEKRERRAMERKLSEMEEELKQLQKLKAENERLKADNRSLTRVINKLTNSAKK